MKLKKIDSRYALYTNSNPRIGLLLDTFARNDVPVGMSDFDESNIDSYAGMHDPLFESYEEVRDYCSNYDVINKAYYNITYACNLRCKYCYASSAQGKHVALDCHERIIDSLISLNTKTISLIGGEPLVHPHFMKLLRSIVDRASFEDIGIITNGTTMPDDFPAFAQKHDVGVQISLDGLSEKANSVTRSAGSFERVYKNIRLLKDEGVRIKVMQTITEDNISEAVGFYSHFQSMGIPVGFFMVKENCSNAVRKPSVQEVIELIDHISSLNDDDYVRAIGIVKIADNMFFGDSGFPVVHCGAGINAISIGPDGNVYPCVKLLDERFIQGNISSHEGLREYKSLRRKRSALPLVNDIDDCRSCDIKYYCGGGCRAEHECSACGFNADNCLYYRRILEYYFDKRIEDYARTSQR